MQPRRSTLERVAEVFEISIDDVLALAGSDTQSLTQQLSEDHPELALAALMSQVPLLGEGLEGVSTVRGDLSTPPKTRIWKLMK